MVDRHASSFVLVLALVGTGAFMSACSGDHGQPADGTTEPLSDPAPSRPAAPDAGAAPPVDAGDVDGGEPDAEPPPPPPKKGAAEACATDAECESNVCFKGNQSSYCSFRCTPDDALEVCVAPFNGVCNMQGYCRRP